MTNKSKVLKVYPSAKCYKPMDHLIIQGQLRLIQPEGFFIYHFNESAGQKGRFQMLSNRCQQENEAWQEAWSYIEKEMLRKLES